MTVEPVSQSSDAGRTKSRVRRALPALLSAAAALALFAVTLGGTYVYDDFDVFALDPRLRDPSQWGRYWTESYNFGVDNLYRPLVSLSYAIQWWLQGADAGIDEADAWRYHAVNWVLHAAVTALVAELARRLSELRAPSPNPHLAPPLAAGVIAGLLFATHPTHVEPVANIVGRAELMCALGVVGALVLLLRPLSIPRAVAITGCFFLALGSKEQGMLTPLLLLILAWATRTRASLPPLLPGEGTRGSHSERKGTRRGALLLVIILLTWTLAAYIAFRESILRFSWDRAQLDWTINPLVRPDADRWIMPLVLLGRYASLLLAPIQLSADYGATVIGWTVRLTDPYLYVGIAAIVAWLAWLIVVIRRRDRVAIFCLLALALTYGVVSNFVLLIGTNFAERLMYLPSVFFIVLVTQLLTRLPRPALLVVMVAVITLFSVRSFTYALRWNDRLSFYQTSLRQHPGSVRLQLLLISEHVSRGELDAAERAARRSTERLPEYWDVWLARAMVAIERGELAEAERFLWIASQTRGAPIPRIARLMTRLEERRAGTEQMKGHE